MKYIEAQMQPLAIRRNAELTVKLVKGLIVRKKVMTLNDVSANAGAQMSTCGASPGRSPRR